MTRLFIPVDECNVSDDGRRWELYSEERPTSYARQGFTCGYQDLLLGCFMRPYFEPRTGDSRHFWLCEGMMAGHDKIRVSVCDAIGLCFVTTKDFPTINQRVAFAILAAREVCWTPAWNAWADDWLLGRDRTLCACALPGLGAAMRADLAAAYAATSAEWADLARGADSDEPANEVRRAAAEAGVWAVKDGNIDLMPIAYAAMEESC